MWQIPPFVIYCIFFLGFFVAFIFLFLFFESKFKQEKKIKKYLDVTFVLPAFNVEKYLERSVDSIKNATYPQEKIRIIIVNDCSTDNTLEIARKLAKNDKRITVLNKKVNTGKADSLNFGIKKAKTELVAVLDADTLIKKDLLKKAVAFFSDDYIAAVTSRLKPLKISNFWEIMQYVEYTFAGFYRKLVCHLNALPVAPAFTIFRREFFTEHGGFDLDNLTEDLEMGLRVQSNHYSLGYVADSYAVTLVPEKFKSLFRQRLRWGYGTLHNYKKYKKLFFNPEYGDLGFFVLPSGFLSILIVSLMLLMGAYTLFAWIVDHLALIIRGWIPTLSFNFTKFIFFISDLRVMLLIYSFFLGALVFFLVRHEMKEKIRFRDYVVNIFVYTWMLAVFYIVSFVYFFRKKKPGW